MKPSTLRRAGLVSGLALIVAIAAAPSFAQEADQSTGLGIKGIGVRLGLNDPEGASSALMYGVHMDAGEFVNNVHIIPSVEYWNVGNDVGSFNSDLSDLAFKLGVNFDFPLQDQRMVPYLGGGFGFHRLTPPASSTRATPSSVWISREACAISSRRISPCSANWDTRSSRTRISFAFSAD